ncbi:MAG: TIGR02391 family protein [Desulfovibrio sp. S3730MH75]|nr:MAG: TIGR02391 family protein [Desulfovibrio sp. S3730MH75]
MFTKIFFTNEHFEEGLVEAVGNRLKNGEYTDAILVGTKYLTDVLRQKGNVEGDGAQLVGQVLGGNAPSFPLNKLQTVSEKNEQKGIEQLLRGFYIGVRNPRTHEITEDTEDFCIRALVIIDTALQYLNRKAEEFDVTAFVDRIYDPHFVPSEEYAQTLVSQVPVNKILDVFLQAFERRLEGNTKDIKHAFEALYQVMPENQIAQAVEKIGDALRIETEASNIASLFRFLKPSSWSLLQADVRIRVENMIIAGCKTGTYDVYSGIKKGPLGTWGNTFGRYFQRKDDLAQALIVRLGSDWYTQNYVGQYFMYSLPVIVTDDELVEKATDMLAYAALDNKAKVVRSKLIDVCQNYPAKWKELLKVYVQERKEYDNDYADKVLELLE